jgi:hypothetical protein
MHPDPDGLEVTEAIWLLWENLASLRSYSCYGPY